MCMDHYPDIIKNKSLVCPRSRPFPSLFSINSQRSQRGGGEGTQLELTNAWKICRIVFSCLGMLENQIQSKPETPLKLMLLKSVSCVSLILILRSIKCFWSNLPQTTLFQFSPHSLQVQKVPLLMETLGSIKGPTKIIFSWFLLIRTCIFKRLNKRITLITAISFSASFLGGGGGENV